MGVPWWGRAMGLASPQARWVSCLHPAPWKLSVLDRCKESVLSRVHSASKGLPRGQPTHHKLHETCFNAKGTRCSLQLLGVTHVFYRLCWEHEKGSGHHQMQSVMLLVFPSPHSFAFSPHSLPLPRQLRQSAKNILCFTRFSCTNLKALTQKEANGVCGGGGFPLLGLVEWKKQTWGSHWSGFQSQPCHLLDVTLGKLCNLPKPHIPVCKMEDLPTRTYARGKQDDLADTKELLASFSCACMCVCAKSLWSCLTICDPMDCSPPDSSWDSPGKKTGVGCHAFKDLGNHAASLLYSTLEFPPLELHLLSL